MVEHTGAELATVVQNFLSDLNSKHKLPAYKLRVLDALLKCRTEYMGGHIQACEGCGGIYTAYNSCRNRHCPKCGAIDKEKWIMAREADLLPVKYFHIVFTVPDTLNTLFLNNQEPMYNLLFKVSWDVLSSFGNTKKWIGGRIGATSILHTWGQNLHYHPHIHYIVPAGALMPNGTWKNSRNRGKYLFKVQQLSNVFRARFVEQLRLLIKNKTVKNKLPDGLFHKDWVVYAKQPFAGPKQVINYLGRYTHKTAISNDRILNVNLSEVTFTWKDYRNNYKKQITSLDGADFLRLFCQHILPPGFTRIRHYGFLSSAAKTKNLPLIRKALRAKPMAIATNRHWKDVVLERMGIKPMLCKECGGRMQTIQTLPNFFRKKQRAPPNKAFWNCNLLN